jgi:phosphoribosylformylglycinamidine (FGAM) synthase PurS component
MCEGPLSGTMCRQLLAKPVIENYAIEIRLT